MVNIKRPNEKDIVVLIHSGDASGRKYLYCEYIRYLTAVCSRYIIEPEDVKDVLHDSFIKIFATIESFEHRGAGSLKAWLSRVVVNEALRFLKSSCRTEIVPITADEDLIADEAPDIEEIPPSVLHGMIRELPTGYRTILNLFVFEEKSHREIAELLGIKESSSASQYHRAKRMLAEKIKKYHNSNVSVSYGR